MNPVKEALDYDLVEGQTIRIKECPRCIGMGSSNGVQITRTDDGFVWYCYRCSKGGFYDNQGMNRHQAKRALDKAMAEHKMTDTKPIQVRLPHDFTNNLPSKALVELWKYHIEDEAIYQRYNLGYSPSAQRLIVPLYSYGQYGSIFSARKLIGHMGRDLTGEHSSKWFMVRQHDIRHPVFVAWPAGHDWVDNDIVLVEDCFSAIKVAMAGYFCLALLTTFVPYELYNRLKKFARVILWLDDDAFDKSMLHMKRLTSYGIPAETRYNTGQDPKYFKPDEIRDIIEDPAIVTEIFGDI